MDLKQLRYCQHRIWLRANDLKCFLLKNAEGSSLVSTLHPCNEEDCPIRGAYKLRQQNVEEQVSELVRGLWREDSG